VTFNSYIYGGKSYVEEIWNLKQSGGIFSQRFIGLRASSNDAIFLNFVLFATFVVQFVLRFNCGRFVRWIDSARSSRRSVR
jgi:hypothetical protein